MTTTMSRKELVARAMLSELKGYHWLGETALLMAESEMARPVPKRTRGASLEAVIDHHERMAAALTARQEEVDKADGRCEEMHILIGELMGDAWLDGLQPLSDLEVTALLASVEGDYFDYRDGIIAPEGLTPEDVIEAVQEATKVALSPLEELVMRVDHVSFDALTLRVYIGDTYYPLTLEPGETPNDAARQFLKLAESDEEWPEFWSERPALPPLPER